MAICWKRAVLLAYRSYRAVFFFFVFVFFLCVWGGGGGVFGPLNCMCFIFVSCLGQDMEFDYIGS